jgi:hypothetical protein
MGQAESPLTWGASEDMQVLGEPVRATITGDAEAYLTTKVADLG